jgi:hypothetical protein
MKWVILCVVSVLVIAGLIAIWRTRGDGSSNVHPRAFQLSVIETKELWNQIGAGGAIDQNARVVIWGGMLPADVSPSDLITFNPSNDSIQELPVTGPAPVGAFVPAVACDTKRNVLYVFGGWPHGAPNPSDALNRVDLGGAQPSRWNLVAKQGAWPAPRNGAVLAYDSVAECLILAYGDGGTHPTLGFTPLDDLWRFDISRTQWTRVSAKGSGPDARWHPMMAVNSTGRRLYLLGGAGHGANDRALYELDLDKNEWQRHRPSGNWPPSLQGASLTFDPDNNVLLLVGGLRHEPPGPATSSEVWIYDVPSGAWSVHDGGESIRRRDHVGVYVPQRRIHSLIGGQISQTIGNFYESGTPVSRVVSVQIHSNAPATAP